jgi:hypothetical protein
MLRNGHRQMLGKHLYRSAFRSEDQARQVHATAYALCTRKMRQEKPYRTVDKHPCCAVAYRLSFLTLRLKQSLAPLLEPKKAQRKLPVCGFVVCFRQ